MALDRARAKSARKLSVRWDTRDKFMIHWFHWFQFVSGARTFQHASGNPVIRDISPAVKPCFHKSPSQRAARMLTFPPLPGTSQQIRSSSVQIRARNLPVPCCQLSRRTVVSNSVTSGFCFMDSICLTGGNWPTLSRHRCRWRAEDGSIQAIPKRLQGCLSRIVDRVARRICNADLLPKLYLLARISDGVVLGLRPMHKLGLRSARKRGLHDIVIHGCAGDGGSIEPTRGDGASERIPRECPNVRLHVVPMETPDGIGQHAANCGPILGGEILPRAVVQSVARGIES